MSHVQPSPGNTTAGDLKDEFPGGFESLNPTAFLDRAMVVYGDRTAVVDGDERWSYAEFGDRCQRQAGMLAALGVKPGDRVGVLAPNGHLLLEAHYGVLF